MLPSSYYYDDSMVQKVYTTDAEHTNFTGEEFMSMFLEQLKSQDPTQPEDANKILEQTSQLANLEAINKQTETLDTLTSNLDRLSTSNYVHYIGKEVELVDNYQQFVYQGNMVDYYFNLPENADYLSIYVTDENGAVVKSYENLTGNTGVNKISWIGDNDFGEAVTLGNYAWNVAAIGSDGQLMEIDDENFKVNSVINQSGSYAMSLDENGYFTVPADKIGIIK